MGRLKRLFIYAGILSLVAFVGKAGFADQAQIGLFTSWTFVKSAMQNYIKAVSNYHQIAIPDQTWSIDQIDWHIQGIKLSSNAVLTNGTLTPSTYTVSASNLGIKVNVKSIWVDQIIHETLNGVTLNIHLKANCGPISLFEPNAQASLLINYKFLPYSVEASASSLKLNWPTKSWVIAPISCQGPIGFASTLTNALQKQLNDPKLVQNFMLQKIDAGLKLGLSAINNKFNVPVTVHLPYFQLPITMKLHKFRTLNSGILISSIVSWPGQPPVYSGPPLPIKQINFNSFSEPVILTNQQDWTSLLKTELNSLSIPIAYNLNKNSLFDSLRSSAFYELFVWPDLLCFHSNSPFTLMINRPHLDSFKWKNNVNFQFSADDRGWVKAFRDGRYWRYLDLSAAAKLNFKPQIRDGLFTAKIAVRKDEINYQFSRGYMARYNSTDQFLNTMYLQNAIANSGAPYTFSFHLPTLGLSFFGTAKFDGIEDSQPNLISIPLKISTP